MNHRAETWVVAVPILGKGMKDKVNHRKDAVQDSVNQNISIHFLQMSYKSSGKMKPFGL